MCDSLPCPHQPPLSTHAWLTLASLAQVGSPNSPPPTPPRVGVPELRINVGIRGSETAVIEVYEGDVCEDVARRFVRKHNLTNSKAVMDKLVKQIEGCRERKRGGSGANNNKPASRGAPMAGDGTKILGRLEVELSDGGKRAIVLREGDDPKLVVSAFCSRHPGKVPGSQQRSLVGMLEDALAGNKKRKERERRAAAGRS